MVGPGGKFPSPHPHFLSSPFLPQPNKVLVFYTLLNFPFSFPFMIYLSLSLSLSLSL